MELRFHRVADITVRKTARQGFVVIGASVVGSSTVDQKIRLVRVQWPELNALVAPKKILTLRDVSGTLKGRTLQIREATLQ